MLYFVVCLLLGSFAKPGDHVMYTASDQLPVPQTA